MNSLVVGEFDLSWLVLGLASNLVWAATTLVGRRLLRYLESRDAAVRRNVLLGLLLANAAVLAASLWLQALIAPSEAWMSLLLIVAGLGWSVFLVMREIGRFWAVGLVGADAEIDGGLGYDSALRLVSSHLAFFGTGAYKLSRSGEFEPALQRCDSTSAIRLLLRRPTDPRLVEAARRAGRPETEYSDRVVESLQRLQRLHQALPNLEVRFYDGDRYFRIMLIDERLALVSPNEYGRGDGSQLPQLHIADTGSGRGSFFQMFERYFNNAWEQAAETRWDFREYV